jgi:hypothetical protein
MSRSGAAPNPTLIQRLRGGHDADWQARKPERLPEIQIEAAEELQRMEYLLTKHKDFLVGWVSRPARCCVPNITASR